MDRVWIAVQRIFPLMNLVYGDSLTTFAQLILLLNLKKKKKKPLYQDSSCYTSMGFWLLYNTEVALAFLQV